MRAHGRRRLYIEANAIAAAHQSGVGHAIRGLVTALARAPEARARYRLTLLVPLRGASRLAPLARAGVQRLTLPLPLRGYDRWAGLRPLPPLDLLLGDGVYVFPNFGNWPTFRSPSVTVIHDLAFLVHPETVEERTRHRLSANAQRWLERTALVVTPSHYVRDQVHALLRVPCERLAVVPWGVDRTVFRPRDGAEVDRVLSKLGLRSGYVLHLGNIEPRKNLVRLVRSYGRLNPSLKAEHPLVLVGGSSWNDEQIDAEIASAQQHGDRVVRIRTRINDDDVPALLTGAAVLAHASLYEGFGMVPLQAMACATPVLASNVSAMPEVDGTAAVFVDPLDEAQITATIEALLTDDPLRRRLIADGMARAGSFSWERSAAALLDVLQRLGPDDGH